MLIATEDLVEEDHGTVLLFGQKDILDGEKIWSIKKTNEAKELSKMVLAKHASMKSR